MDISGRVWQVAAGDTNRNYVDVCLDWDVVIMGPGRFGPWKNGHPYTPDNTGESKRKLAILRRFCEEINDGDIVVLRLGTREIRGVGVVRGEAIWCAHFSDIDGWDLEHARRVKWLRREPYSLEKYALKFGDTVQQLTSEKVLKWLRALAHCSSEMSGSLRPLPPAEEVREESAEDISEYLFGMGVAGHSINALTLQMAELSRIARWYQNRQAPSESETLAYLVVPLLRAIGWTPQKMAVEWKKIDIALFSALPRRQENLSAVVEVKRKGLSCLTAHSQAKRYAEELGSDVCRRLIVTDGLRYAIYFRSESGFSLKPKAYLNLTRPRSGYPIYACEGAKEALLYMSSDWSNG